MLVNEEEQLSRLLKLVNDDTVTDPIATLRQEVKAEFGAKQQEAKERALNSHYRISRVELRKVYEEAINELRSVIDVVEVIDVTAGDLPQWCEKHGVKISQMSKVLSGDMLECSGHGQVYRSFFGYPRHLPSSEEIEQKKQDRLEDERELAQAAKRAETRKQASPRAIMPQLSFWKGNR